MKKPLNLASDNVHGAHPRVLAALARCNEGAAGSYGADPVTARAEALLRELFAAPEAVVRLVATGTAANALVCAQLSPGYGRIYCHEDAHVRCDECSAPEFFTHGARLVGVGGTHGRIDPALLERAVAAAAGGSLNDGMNALVSVTNATEWGTCYAPQDLRAIAAIAHGAGMRVHLDGARLANAVAALGVQAAAFGPGAGVDALCLGATKNGAIAAEAMIFFDPGLAQGFDWRRKQAGHVWSKQRFLAAQIVALFEDGLWLELAAHANAMAAALGQGIAGAGLALVAPVEANEVFARLPAALHRRACGAGLVCHLWPDPAIPDPAGPAEGAGEETVVVRLVTGWATTPDEIGQVVAVLSAG